MVKKLLNQHCMNQLPKENLRHKLQPTELIHHENDECQIVYLKLAAELLSNVQMSFVVFVVVLD